jgi:phosphoglycolate phosphatase-like HAD superfamily hydrolase
MIRFDAIIFDFDGVLLESEFEGNARLAELLTDLGHRTSVEEALRHYVGLSGQQFINAIEERIGCRLPEEFHERLEQHSSRALREGIRAVVGAVEFVRSLPPGHPLAVASSSSTRWIRGHLDHLGLADAFGEHIYSGREHVTRKAGSRPLSSCRGEAQRRHRSLLDSGGFGGGRDRGAGVRRDGDRPGGRVALPGRPCGDVACDRGPACRR